MTAIALERERHLDSHSERSIAMVGNGKQATLTRPLGLARWIQVDILYRHLNGFKSTFCIMLIGKIELLQPTTDC